MFSQEPLHYVVGKDEFDGVHLYSIIQDEEDNSIWVTSNKGLHNYNGINFKTFKLENTKSHALFQLVKDNYGTIFCHNLNGQIYRIKDKKIELYYTLPKGYFKDVTINFDDKNNMFIATGNFLLKISPDKKLISKKENEGYFLYKKDKAIVYSRQFKDGSTKFISEKDSKEQVIATCNTEITYQRTVGFKNKKYLYCYDMMNGYMIRIQDTSIVQYKFPFLTDNNFLMFSDNQNAWFSDYKNGVYKIPSSKIDDPKTFPQKWFSNYYISRAFIDNENNTWLLTFKKGIIIIPNISVKKRIYKIKDKTFKGMYKSEDKLFLSTSDSEIHQFKNHKFHKIASFKNRDRLEYFAIHKNGEIIVTNNYVYKNNQNISKNSFARKSLYIKDTIYKALYNCLSALNIKNLKIKNIVSRRTHDLAYDSIKDKIWISSTAGISYYKNGKEVPILYKNKPIFIDKLTVVGDEIWGNSQNGVFVIKNDSVHKILTTKSGLLSNKIRHIKYEKPFVYLSSQNGIQKYNRVTNSIQSLTKSDGLTYNILNFEVINNMIYALTSDALILFDFENLDKEIPKYTTQITEALADGNKTIANNEILNPDQNNIEFSFLTTSFKYQKDLSYTYQLKGYEKAPVKAKIGQYFATYPNLPSGTYTFEVQSFIKGKRNKPASLTFTVDNYWYNTLWFKLLMVFIALLMFYSIYKVRLNNILQKRDKEEMQKRLAESSLTSLKAQMNPHFLFNAMNSIQFLILNNQKEEAYSYLTQLSNLVRENLRMSDVSFVPFYDELGLIKKYLKLERLRFEETLVYEIHSNINEEQVLVPSMVIQPFIENAIKHGLLHKRGDRRLHIAFKKENDLIICEITDNGIGRKASEELKSKRSHQSFATNAIQKRFDILREYYKIAIGFEYEDLFENNQPSGTRVIIKIPCNTQKL